MSTTTKKKLVKITTPAGIASYPKLNKPDTKFKAEGEYGLKLIIGAAESEELRAILDAAHTEHFEATKAALIANKDGAKAKLLKKADPCYKQQLDKETGEPTGNFVFGAGMRASYTDKVTKVVEHRTPGLFDAGGNPMTAQIWSGSKVKVSAFINTWETPAAGCGVSLRLRGVQVLTLVSSGSGTAEDMGFGKEDGYDAEPVAAAGAATAGDDDEF